MKVQYSLKYKRRREGKTDYRKRLDLLVSGKKRLVIRKSLNYVRAQIIDYAPDGDIVIASADSKELEKYGWDLGKKNIPAAYLTGLIIAKKAKEKGIKEAILDVGVKKPTIGSAIYSCAKGAIDGGLKIPFGEGLVKDDRINGRHIEKYASIAKGTQFSNKKNSKNIVKLFEEVKKKII